MATTVESATFAGMSAAQRTAGLSALREIEAAHRVRLAFFSGSLVAGLGHANSDVDIHMILESGDKLPHQMFDRDGVRVQATVVDDKVVYSAADRTKAFATTTTDRDQVTMTDTAMWHFARVCTSELVSGSDEELIAAYEHIDRAVASKVLMARFAADSAIFTDDANGMLQRGAYQSAYYAAGIALKMAIDVVLASERDLYVLPKFLFARVGRSKALAGCSQLWHLLMQAPDQDDDEALTANTFRLLRAAQQLVGDALLRGWDAPLEEARVPANVISGPTRTPFYGLIRFADAWGMPGPNGPLRASEEMASLWAAANGRPASEIVAELERAGVQLQPGEFDAALAKFVERGVLTP